MMFGRNPGKIPDVFLARFLSDLSGNLVETYGGVIFRNSLHMKQNLKYSS